MQHNNRHVSSRRGFLGTLATGAAALGAVTLTAPLAGAASSAGISSLPGEADAWFNQIKGKHRMVFDVPQPHGVYPFAWPKVFLMTNAATGTPEKENSVVVVLRHDAVSYALESRLWDKYKLGEAFKAPDPLTGKPALRNPFWEPKEGDFKVPGIGNVAIGINELQESGVLFCACEMAITVYSAALAESMGLDAAAVREEWIAGLLPGIQPVPSGIWALGRAQERGCFYCFTG